MRGDAPLIVVDPIDGTKNFVEGHREFCIAVALVGRVPGGVWPIAGVVAVPVEDVMFVSDGESVTEERISSGESSPLVRQERAEAEISASSADRRWLSDNSVELRSPWVSSGSSVYDMTGTVRGRLHGSVVGSQRFWDLMAPLALASAAGLELQDLLTGERITSIRPEDISGEFRSRLWGLNRKVAILPSGRTLIDVVKHLA
jgi:fructose-1,6-bisphosphatase/inositol monophosphatase family enzyme